MPFEIHDDIEVLRRLGFNHCSRNDITSLLPPHLHSYLPPNVLANQGLFVCFIFFFSKFKI